MRNPIRPGKVAVVLIAALGWLAAPATSQATAANPAAFDRANALFADGKYGDAVAQYQAALRADGYSAPALFNLGNAQYRAGQFGAAVLDFERAQVLAPHDAGIAANLRLARERAGVPAPVFGVAETASRFLSANALAWTGSLALAAFCLAVGVGRWFPGLPYARAAGALAVGLLLVVVAGLAIRWTEFDRAIVIAADAPVRIAPATTAAQSFALKPGEPVTITRAYGQFVLARTPDGRSGWMSEKDLGSVYAAHAAS
jgi:tetratricopeptide (TPR) repeat protein